MDAIKIDEVSYVDCIFRISHFSSHETTIESSTLARIQPFAATRNEEGPITLLCEYYRQIFRTYLSLDDASHIFLVVVQSERRHGQNQRCTCPDPSVPLAGSQKFWKTHHNQMVKLAQNAPKNLDIVFVGDSIVERWQGTTDLGLTVLDKNMKEPFQTRFVKNNGAELEGLALGASSDTVGRTFLILDECSVFFLHMT